MRSIRLISTLFSLVFLLPLQSLKADEGMWLPILLQQLNEADMQAMGMKMTAEDIYSVNKSSLKDAVVIFGGGCTGEVISPDGLLLTNHHCGYGTIQRHSSVVNDYLTDGFWAKSREEELQNKGLTVTFIIRMDDVTKEVLTGVTDDMNEGERTRRVNQNIQAISQKAIQGTHYGAIVRPFYYGNEYYLFLTETFRDVRLVGAPPSAIGKYGGDTDNWMWPRHTGDFSLFRIYSGPDGKPADYSPENIPFKPRHHLPISLQGLQKDDFTMVYGFPGRTQEYLTSFAVDLITNQDDPIKIKLRHERLEAMNKEMKKSDKVRIQYASKQSRISNGYKKWKGEVRGLKKDKAIQKKKNFEAEFQANIEKDPQLKQKYGNLLGEFETNYKKLGPVLYDLQYITEGILAIETMDLAGEWSQYISFLETDDEVNIEVERARLKKYGKSFFKNYHRPIDEEIMASMIGIFMEDVPEERQPEVFDMIRNKFDGDAQAFTKHAFETSVFVDVHRYMEALKRAKAKDLNQDPIYQIMKDVYTYYLGDINPRYAEIRANLDRLNRTYMKALREVLTDKKFYPDANFTLRVTFGKVEGYTPDDAIHYRHYTTLDGVLEKYDPTNDEFVLPEKLIELHKNKDYGPYGQDGELWVCFTASNHTSGGNSGSPVINAEGHLIGLNFDRNWEGTMSDINYDISQCRNISVDIRYVLFIMDKFAGASYLLDELTLIKPEPKPKPAKVGAPMPE